MSDNLRQTLNPISANVFVSVFGTQLRHIQPKSAPKFVYMLKMWLPTHKQSVTGPRYKRIYNYMYI